MTKVYVIGGATVDLFGIPFHPLKEKDSNPGKLQISFGGVARNIAENLVRMDVPVTFVTALGNDLYGKELLTHCNELGMDLTYSLILNEERTATYMALLDHDNEMHIALSDMQILNCMTQAHLVPVFESMKSHDVLFMDTNFDAKLIAWMLDHAPCPVFMDPISKSKVEKLDGLLSKIHTFKPNLLEAQHLSGIQVNQKSDLIALASFFIDQGIKQVYISLGKDGLFGLNVNQAILASCEPPDVVNVTGAGDAMMAALIHQYVNQSSMEDAMKYSLTAAAMTVSHEQSVHPSISKEAVESLMMQLVHQQERYW